MQYIVLTGKDEDDLAVSVNHYLNDNWKLVGGVSVSISVYMSASGEDKERAIFAQAMVKDA
jgi:hypothetical protein